MTHLQTLSGKSNTRLLDGYYTFNLLVLSRDPISQTQTPLPTPSRPGIVSTATSRLQVSKGITRTQSGTYIPNLSKQPTPAPSDVSDEGDTGVMQGMEDEEGAEHPVPGTFMTASHTPLGHEDTDVEEGLNQVDNANDGLPSSSLARGDGSSAPLARVGHLEQLLEEKELELSDLRVAMDGHETRISSLQDEIEASEVRLRKEAAKRELGESELQARVNEIAVLKERLVEVEGELCACRAGLATAMNKVDDLTGESEGKSVTIATVEAALATSQGQLESRREQVRQLEVSLTELQADTAAEKEASKQIHLQLEERSQQVEGLEAESLREKGIRESLEKSLSSTTDKLASVERRLLEVQASADQKDERLGQAAEKLSDMEAANVEFGHQIDGLQRELGSTKRALSDLQGLVDNSNEELATRELTVQDLSAKLADAEQRVATAEEARLLSEDRAEGVQQELNRKIAGLEEKVAADQTQISTLHSMRASLEVQLDQERATLVGTNAEVSRITTLSEAGQNQLAVAEEDKIHLEQKVRQLEGELSAARGESSRTARNVEELKAWVEGYRQNQMATIDTFASKVSPQKLSLCLFAN